MKPRWPIPLVLLLIAAASQVGCGPGRGPEPRDEGAWQQGGTVVDVPDEIQEDPSILSPPILEEPLLDCGVAVGLRGLVPDGTVEIIANGTDSIGTAPTGDGGAGSVSLSVPLEAGWVVTATQSVGTSTSDPSTERIVSTIADAYPDGLPRPDLYLPPLYRCGEATAVRDLPPGGSVDVFSNVATRIGGGTTAWPSRWVGVSPAFEEGHSITAISSICGNESQASAARVVQPAPTSLPAPAPEEPHDQGTLMIVRGLVHGARVRVTEPGTGILRGQSVAAGSAVNLRLNPAAAAGEPFEVEQQLCDVTSSPATVTTLPCSDLPAPVLLGPAPGDLLVYLDGVVPGARVLIYSGSDEIGDGGGSVIQLVRPVLAGETLIAIQVLGGCRSGTGYQVDVGTGLNDPGDSGVCEFSSIEYGENGNITTDVSDFFNSPASCVSDVMSAAPLHGLARIPNGPGRFPMAMIVHGNHAAQEASEPGYDYLLDHLARHCMIAVSVDQNYLNLCSGGPNVSGEMDARAIVLLRHLQLWRGWDQDPGHDLFAKVDTDRVMLMGHSRGGEAITVAKKLNNWLDDPADSEFDFGFGIRSLYAIAPVADQITSDVSVPISPLPLDDPLVVEDADYFVVHGSHDGDVANFAGHKTFDRAYPVDEGADHFKALLFVHGANHAQWNSVWVSSPDFAPTIPDADVLAINKVYATAFAYATLMEWPPYRALFKGEADFPSLPAAGIRVKQYQDPERSFLNHWEEDDDPATGSRGGVSNATNGGPSPYEERAFSFPLFGPPEPNHWLWQDTDGLVLGWTGTGAELVVSVPPEVGPLTTSYPYLGLRVGQVFDPDGSHNPAGIDKDLTVQLHFAGGATSAPVRVADHAHLPYPVQVTGTWLGDATKTVMTSARIPWASFAASGEGLPWASLTEIRFRLDRHPTGLVVVDEIQLTQ